MNPLTAYQDPVGRYAFHTTQQENINSIQEHGIRSNESTNHDTVTVETILTELGYNDLFPFDRTTVTYCHIDSQYVAESLPSQTDSTLPPCETAVVINVEKLTAPLYIADMAHISDLLDYWHVNANLMLRSDTPEEAITQYQNSITRVQTPDDITDHLQTEIDHVELIIDGDVPPEAIIDIVE